MTTEAFAGSRFLELARVAYVLVLIQVGTGLLAMIGELLFMGNPVYALIPLLKSVALVLLAVLLASGRMWVPIALLCLEGLSLSGVGVSLLVGLLPGLDRTMTVSGLLTEVALPLTIAVLCAQLLPARKRPGAAASFPRGRADAVAAWTRGKTSPPAPHGRANQEET